MSSSATMQQAKTNATQPAQHQQSSASNIRSELSDQRPQATAQRQLQETANNSPQSHQLNTFQQMAQNSARATQLKAMSAMMNAPAVQRVEEEEPLQAKSATETAQRDVADAAEAPKPNNTGLPDNLKSGVESLSGMSMDHVKVHYNSSQPAQLNAHAYAQGSEIHVAPGQERHLPHEAWHVVQQAQGRVQPTMLMKAGVPVNDDAGLEAEADAMGAKALQLKKHNNPIQFIKNAGSAFHLSSQTVAQRAATKINYTTGNFTYTDTNGDEQEQEVGIGMTAHLNPAQAREGTSPGGMDDLMTALGDEYSHQRMIRGHLLNGNLGGLGIPENLFPITNRANRLHETQVENHVKKEIEDGNETDYHVTVINAAMTQDDPDATFHCEAWQADGTKIIDKEINSIPSANRRNSASVDDNQEDEMDNKVGGIRYRNVDLPQGWGERGSGRRGEIVYEHVTGNKYNLRDNTDNSLNATINE